MVVEVLPVLHCTNAYGSEKPEPLTIGKLSKLKCFKGIYTFPHNYAGSSNAWISAIFVNILKQPDARMRTEN